MRINCRIRMTTPVYRIGVLFIRKRECEGSNVNTAGIVQRENQAL